jgi:hypothetical protein
MANLLEELIQKFFPKVAESGRFFPLAARCGHCGEIVRAQINLYNDLSLGDSGNEGSSDDYVCRKVLVGNGRCYRPLEVTLKFNAHKQLLEKTVSGGEWVEE